MSATPPSRTLVEARGLVVEHDGRRVLDDVSVTVSRGEIVTLIGLNGAGKSTLVRVLLGLAGHAGGEIVRAPGLRVGYSPQQVHVEPTMPLTVRRFLTLGAHAPRAELERLLDEVGAGAVLERPVAEILGGEMHRVLLARALLRNPDLLVLDEPMAGVDVSGQSELYRLIGRIRDRRDCGVLLVSHDLHVVMAATDTVVCLNHHVCCTGHPNLVASHPQFVQLFGRHVAEVLAVYAHEHDHRHASDGHAVPIEPTKRDATGDGA